jgi:hypothetical protein
MPDGRYPPRYLRSHTAADLQTAFLSQMDHELCTLSDARLAFVNHADIHRICQDRLILKDILWRDTLIEDPLLREAFLNLGATVSPCPPRSASAF